MRDWIRGPVERWPGSGCIISVVAKDKCLKPWRACGTVPVRGMVPLMSCWQTTYVGGRLG